MVNSSCVMKSSTQQTGEINDPESAFRLRAILWEMIVLLCVIYSSPFHSN